MSVGPYTEGWPRKVMAGSWPKTYWEEVVRLSDAERMREALDAFAVSCERVADRNVGHPDAVGIRELAAIARAALNPEQDKPLPARDPMDEKREADREATLEAAEEDLRRLER